MINECVQLSPADVWFLSLSFIQRFSFILGIFFLILLPLWIPMIKSIYDYYFKSKKLTDENSL